MLTPSHPASFHRPDKVDEPLYVITPLFNPQRFRSRWKLYKQFEKYVLDTGEANLVTIECSFGNRAEVVTEAVNDRHMVIHVKTKHEIWIKENLINIAIQRLPGNWKYCAWIDADVHFARPDWVGETIQQLQHYDVAQMFSSVIDLDYDNHPYNAHHGFVYSYINSMSDTGVAGKAVAAPTYGSAKISGVWHPGFAWAATRSAIDHLGGLIDFALLGAGDHHMAHALTGKPDTSIPKGISPEYMAMIKEWENRAERHIRRNVGYVDGLLLHYFHGSKKFRKYAERWRILIANGFTPSLDLKRDSQGVYQLTDRSISLRDGCREYFRQRNEDSIDLLGHEKKF